MTENISNFISFHNANIQDNKLVATLENISDFAHYKAVALEDLSIEKHRLPYINWITGLTTSSTD